MEGSLRDPFATLGVRTSDPGLPLRGKPGHPIAAEGGGGFAALVGSLRDPFATLGVRTSDPGLPLRGKPGHPHVAFIGRLLTV